MKSYTNEFQMNVSPDVNYEELARSTDDFNGAQLKAVCVEAGILYPSRVERKERKKGITKRIFFDTKKE